jgi:hypothetical protein
MWRGVQACLPWEAGPVPECSEKGLNKGTCTPFAFGPCNMNDVELIDLGTLISVRKVLEIAKGGIPSDRSYEATVSFQLCSEYPSGQVFLSHQEHG